MQRLSHPWRYTSVIRLTSSESVLFEPLNLIRAINEKARYRDGSNLLF